MPWRIFVTALIIRWVYAVIMFWRSGDAGLMMIDSEGYLFYAHEFAASLQSGSLSGFEWFGPVWNAMPLAQWLVSLCALLFGASAALAYVLLQGVFDAGTCLLVFGIARTVDKSCAALAGFAAAFNPTQIVLSGLVLTDTPFAFFTALFLFAAVQWVCAPAWRWVVVLGFALGAAAMTRALAEPFAALMFLFMLTLGLIQRPFRRLLVQQSFAGAVIFCLCLAPVVWRNVSEFGSWSITPQSGTHLALWVAPLVKEVADGTPWAQSHNEMQRRVDERYPTPSADPFERSRRYQEIAREELKALGIAAMAKAWLVGAAINLGSPAIILSPPILVLPRTGFYATPGVSPLDKIKNFLFHSDNATYAWILLAGITGLLLARLIQLIGAIVLLRDRHPAVLCLFGLWIAYVLAVNGPVASPKYRLPIEPPLMVLTGAGLSVLLRRRRFLDH